MVKKWNMEKVKRFCKKHNITITQTDEGIIINDGKSVFDCLFPHEYQFLNWFKYWTHFKLYK